jgi:polar amino acid transport system substrate-binding protein
VHRPRVAAGGDRLNIPSCAAVGDTCVKLRIITVGARSVMLVAAIVFLFSFFGLAHADSTSPQALRLGSDVWPPFTDVSGKQRVALDLVHAALERSGIQAKTVLRDDFGDLIDDIRRGDEIDGSAALWRNEEREKDLLFSRPYLENRLVLLARKGTDVSAESLATLVDKRVGLVEGYDYGGAVAGAKGSLLVRGSSDQTNLRSLLDGRLDYILVDELLVYDMFERHGDRADALLVAGTTPIVERALHFAIRRSLPNAIDIVEKFDRTIRQMMADGAYNRLLGVTWVRADLDGDGKSELVLGGVQAGDSPPLTVYDVYGPQLPPAGSSDQESGYVVGGKAYEDWNQIPERYKVPVDRNYEGPEPGLVLVEF